MEYFALGISVCSFIFGFFVWDFANQESKRLEKLLYKRDRWGELKQDIRDKRLLLENQLATFQNVGLLETGTIDYILQIRKAYKQLIASHSNLSFTLLRISQSNYVLRTSDWSGLAFKPIVDGETLTDRTGEMMNDINDPMRSEKEIGDTVAKIASEFGEMLKLLHTAIEIEDIDHDPDKY